MASPPSLASLQISSPADKPPSSPKDEIEDPSSSNGEPKTNGQNGHASIVSKDFLQAIPPLTSDTPKAPKANGVPPSIPRPAPPANMASAPAVPNMRSPPSMRGMTGRGGMPGPMGMRGPIGMRGPQQQMESRIPASLQAKMDRVSKFILHHDSVLTVDCRISSGSGAYTISRRKPGTKRYLDDRFAAGSSPWRRSESSRSKFGTSWSSGSTCRWAPETNSWPFTRQHARTDEPTGSSHIGRHVG
jgi:hypothetical protein